ncbi:MULTISPECIES: phosphoribosyltransferase-like protein [Aeromonas]
MNTSTQNIRNTIVTEKSLEDFFEIMERRPDVVPEHKYDSLNTLWNACDREEQQNLIKKLIFEFFVLDSSKQLEACRRIATFVKERQFKNSNTLIIGVANDKEIDGSTAALQVLKNKFHDAETWHSRFYPSIPAGVAEIKNGNDIILFDDFIGSGDKVLRKKKWVIKILKEHYKEINVETLKFHVMSFAGMFSGLEKIDNDIEIKYTFSSFILTRGISDMPGLDQDAIAENIREMKELEEKLGKNYINKKISDYSLGYSRSETLYCAINDNCPNNVFPIFWWPKLANGEQYETLFHRVG